MKKTVSVIGQKDTSAPSNEKAKKKINVASYCRVSTESDEQLNNLAVKTEFLAQKKV